MKMEDLKDQKGPGYPRAHVNRCGSNKRQRRECDKEVVHQALQ